MRYSNVIFSEGRGKIWGKSHRKVESRRQTRACARRVLTRSVTSPDGVDLMRDRRDTNGHGREIHAFPIQLSTCNLHSFAPLRSAPARRKSPHLTHISDSLFPACNTHPSLDDRHSESSHFVHDQRQPSVYPRTHSETSRGFHTTRCTCRTLFSPSEIRHSTAEAMFGCGLPLQSRITAGQIEGFLSLPA